jgi:hypothetical protein
VAFGFWLLFRRRIPGADLKGHPKSKDEDQRPKTQDPRPDTQDQTPMKLPTFLFKTEPIWILIFGLAPAVIGLILALVVLLR